MINFTVGPVQSSEAVRAIGAENTPYFRTPEFSAIMLENEKLMKELAGAADDSRVVFMTGSGTASMEAVVMHTLDKNDKAIVINGGSFGDRFEKLLDLHEIPHDVIRPESGHTIKAEDLEPYEGKGYTAFLVNTSETSTGVLYDINMISDFCKRNDIFLITDNISAFLADKFNMKEAGADVMITGSQKALAVPPGISVIVLSKRALDRVERIDTKSMYLDLKAALLNMERGQTPFTPAVTTLLQINERLKEIIVAGGVAKENERIAHLAAYFREKIKDFPFEFYADHPTNSVTALKTAAGNAKEIFSVLKDEYGIWICPNGGDLAETVFRVGHIGELSEADYDKLLEALKDLRSRGIV